MLVKSHTDKNWDVTLSFSILTSQIVFFYMLFIIV